MEGEKKLCLTEFLSGVPWFVSVPAGLAARWQQHVERAQTGVGSSSSSIFPVLLLGVPGPQ